MKTIRAYFPGGKSKAVALSYDDGVNFDRRLIEILNGCGMKGTFNLNSGQQTEACCWLTRDGRDMIKKINLEDVPAVYEGHEVALHGYTHPYWTTAPREQMLYELMEDKRTLEHTLGYPVRGLAYPFSSCDEYVLSAARLLGMAYGRVTGREEYFQLPRDVLQWRPTCFHRDKDLMEKARRFVKEDFNTMALFCVAGHTFDFANDDNWNIIEEFCDFISRRDEIWYATCVEIFDYVHAVKELIYTVDCTIVSNPTARDICLCVDQEKIILRGGESRCL